MARDEVDRFEKYLEEKRSYRMLTEYIKMTYNEFYYCNYPHEMIGSVHNSCSLKIHVK
jgi:hypothetical protein